MSETESTLGPLPNGVRHPYTALLEALPRTANRTLVEALELPAIATAWRHASTGEARELAALDRSLLENPAYAAEAAKSLQLGHESLKHLLPLRDSRPLQRHADAVENGEAPGGHLAILGLMMALFSIPPRQALLDYARARLPQAGAAPDVISGILDQAA
ncbi:MAG: hypothetical protein CMO74_02280 [Verrucomicrobiales bacterium]|nr:hypothetical protein [Verrucomicrobiales bacterium]